MSFIPPPTDRITVLVVDPSERGRRALRHQLQDDPAIRVVSDTGGDPLQLAQRLRPDVILIDPEVNGRFDLDLVETLHKAVPDSHVCVCTRVFTPEAYEGAWRARARGYLLKEAADREALHEALVAVGGYGALFVGPAAAARLDLMQAEVRLVTPDKEKRKFTPRERDVLRLLVGGTTRAEIGKRIGLSDRTVARVIASLYSKLGVSSGAALAAAAERFGLIPRGDRGTDTPS